ncbi:hypothetical protein PR002_g30268 [Phytophthora rubi]|uniref:Uncharacterized protein n=1 Tax=Phytophthora rubi TaxID=129364 RepID=A0A6A3GTM0_9STRA|nr:hypothetical protein PR002_g30268 [Phytophthora rubi]
MLCKLLRPRPASKWSRPSLGLLLPLMLPHSRCRRKHRWPHRRHQHCLGGSPHAQHV